MSRRYWVETWRGKQWYQRRQRKAAEGMWHSFLKGCSNISISYDLLTMYFDSLPPERWGLCRVELVLCDFLGWGTQRTQLPLDSLFWGAHGLGCWSLMVEHTWNLAAILWGSPGHRERPHGDVLADSSNSQDQPPNIGVREPSGDSSPAACRPFQWKPNGAHPWLSTAQITGSRAK